MLKNVLMLAGMVILGTILMIWGGVVTIQSLGQKIDRAGEYYVENIEIAD